MHDEQLKRRNSHIGKLVTSEDTNRNYRRDSLEGKDFIIESGVEISQRRPTTNRLIAAMKLMKIGDSMQLPGSYKRSGGNLRLYSSIAGIEVTTRKQSNGEIRMWRIR